MLGAGVTVDRETAKAKITRRLSSIFAAAFLVLAGPAGAEFSQYDTQTYDITALGVPKFINTNYIDLTKITQISKFRSGAGHDYSDGTQFGTDVFKAQGVIEACSSMKHYFGQPDTSTDITAPVSGIVSRIFEESLGSQVHITSDVQPAFTIIIFHVRADKPFSVGDHITEGQHLGKHFTIDTMSDIAVAVHTPTGYHLVSYFETLTDAGFAPFKARGIASPSDLVITRAQRAAAPITCAGAAFANAPLIGGSDYVPLSDTAVHQTIALQTTPNASIHVNDPAFSINATASSGLPVSITPLTPKVCIAANGVLYWRRPGYCMFSLSQAGDANTTPANTLQYGISVLAQDAGPPGLARLGSVYPPSASGPRSFLRLINSGGAAGTVTVTLTDATSGNGLFTWTSPVIPAHAAPQYDIAALESAAPAGFVRPAMYGLKVEQATTMTGFMQHVLFHPLSGTLTNVSTCSSGVTASASVFGNVHSSLIGGAGFPSWVVVHNASGASGVNEFIDVYDAGGGLRLGQYLKAPIAANAGPIVAVSDMEAGAHITPGAISHYLINPIAYPAGFLQHLVINQQAGVITDMTTVCALDGVSKATAAEPLRAGALFSSQQPASQSFLRFYNAGSFPATATVTLYDNTSGQDLGHWTSPSIVPNSEQQFAISTIESVIGLVKHDYYELSVVTDMDGYFQHVLYRPADGTLTNLSTCQNATTTDPRTLIGVHSSLVGVAGFPSSVVVNNTGTADEIVTLGIYDARDGTQLGTYPTSSIPANGQLTLSMSAIEAAAHITPTPLQLHYVVKAEGAFTGFLQNLVNNVHAGVITDMSTICLM